MEIDCIYVTNIRNCAISWIRARVVVSFMLWRGNMLGCGDKVDNEIFANDQSEVTQFFFIQSFFFQGVDSKRARPRRLNEDICAELGCVLGIFSARWIWFPSIKSCLVARAELQKKRRIFSQSEKKKLPVDDTRHSEFSNKTILKCTHRDRKKLYIFMTRKHDRSDGMADTKRTERETEKKWLAM